MRLNFTKILGVITALVVCMSMNIFAQNAVKRVVLEDHTGAWCGWCTEGMEIAEELEEKYGDRFIPVGVHNGDAMALDTYQKNLSEAMGVTGYPTATVDRYMFPDQNRQAQSRGLWESMSLARLEEAPTVGVSVDWNLDKSTGELTATVTADVLENIDKQLSFSLWVMEDYVTGSGNGYTQQNYPSKQTARNQNSIYYYYPGAIQNFYHMNVLREPLGGLWGENGSFGPTSSPGEYTHQFTTNVSSYAQDIDYIYVVAVIHDKGTREILNAVQDGRNKDRDAEAEITSEATHYETIETSGSSLNEITLKNSKDFSVDINIRIEPTKSIIPQGWDVSLDKSKVTIPANGTAKVNVISDSKNNPGFATVDVVFEPDIENYRNLISATGVHSLSEKTEQAYFFINDNGINLTLSSAVKTGKMSKLGIVPLNPKIAEYYPQFQDIINTAIFTVDDGYVNGISVEATKSNLQFLEGLMDNGTDVLIAAPFDLINTGANTGTSQTDEAMNFFNNRLGVQYAAYLQTFNGQNYSKPPFVGRSGDEIGDGIEFEYHDDYDQSGGYPFAYLVALMSLNGKTNAEHFLSIDHTQINNVNESSSRAAIRLDDNGQRTIFSSISLDQIPNPERDLLMERMLTWLQGESAGGPSISLSTDSHDFGVVKTGETDSFIFTIESGGNDDLEINSITFEDGSNFELGTNYPEKLIPKATADIEVVFTPTENKQYSDKVIISSNDPDDPEMTISLTGSGAASSVQPEGVISDMFEMKINPNPISETGTLEYNVSGNSAKNLSINLIDASGRVVSNLYNGSAVNGQNNIEINASELASGKYIIIANIDGNRTQLPLMISK